MEIITKRIAIELYGLIRTPRATFDKFFFNVIKAKYQYNYIVDIFIHTWNKTNSSDIVWHNQNGKNRAIVFRGYQFL